MKTLTNQMYWLNSDCEYSRLWQYEPGKKRKLLCWIERYLGNEFVIRLAQGKYVLASGKKFSTVSELAGIFNDASDSAAAQDGSWVEGRSDLSQAQLDYTCLLETVSETEADNTQIEEYSESSK